MMLQDVLPQDGLAVVNGWGRGPLPDTVELVDVTAYAPPDATRDLRREIFSRAKAWLSDRRRTEPDARVFVLDLRHRVLTEVR